MTVRTFRTAWEKAMKNFMVYSLSLTAAISLSGAIRGQFESVNQWLVTIVLIIVTTGFISLVTYLDPTDDDDLEAKKSSKINPPEMRVD
jgi:hypothetical protein